MANQLMAAGKIFAGDKRADSLGQVRLNAANLRQLILQELLALTRPTSGLVRKLLLSSANCLLRR